MPARPSAQAAPQVEGRPAPRRDLPLDHPGRPHLRPPNPPGIRSSRRGDSQRRQRGLRFAASRWWGGAVVAGPGDEIAAAEGRGRGGLRASHADREQVIEALKAAFVQGVAGQGRIRPAGGPGVRGPDPRGAGRSHRWPPRRADHGQAARARPRPERAASCAARPADRGGDRGLCGRVDVRVPRALAQGFRGRSSSRSCLARLLDHPHLPVRSGHDPVARRGGDG